MKNKRQPLDYLRRWPILKRWLIDGGADGPRACPTRAVDGMKGTQLSMPWLKAILKRLVLTFIVCDTIDLKSV
jgi:hypothetical protein